MTHDWKSTVSGILTGLIGTFNGLLALQIPLALLSPQTTRMWLWITLGCNVGVIVGKVWLGVVTKNADAAAVAQAMNAPPSAPPPTAASLSATPKTP